MDIFHHVSNDFQILLHKFDALKKEEKSRCTKSSSSEKRRLFHINKQLKMSKNAPEASKYLFIERK